MVDVLRRYEGNPILSPIPDHPWESRRVFNCAAIYEEGRVHILYRAQGEDEVSRIGYASSSDGVTIDERLPEPILQPSGSKYEELGCEDPRATRIGDRLYLTYTAYGRRVMWRRRSKERLAQVALTSIDLKDFLNREWRWSRRIYPFPGVDDKNSVLFPVKMKGMYAMYHRIPPYIWVAYSDSLEDWSRSVHRIVMRPSEPWERVKVGAGAPPIRVEGGWLLIYHGVDESFTYRLGAALVSDDDPERIVKLRVPILEPRRPYEERVVFTCGAVVLDGELIVYYGMDDLRIGVAKAHLSDILHLFDREELVVEGMEGLG